MSGTRLLHVSDLHFGQPSVPEQIAAIERVVENEIFDVVAVSGDLSQRARADEFQRAAAFLECTARHSRPIVVPGNHDVQWWLAPLGVGGRSRIYAEYRRYISRDLEPVLRVPGATFVGLNTAHGVTVRTLTWNVRDLSIIGDLRNRQLERAEAAWRCSPPTDARVLVVHHNPMAGELSQRHGLKHTTSLLARFGEMGVDLVLCGHDHQEAVHYVEHTKKGTVISTAGTVSNRSRGGRPSSFNVIDITERAIEITTRIWSREQGTFVPGPTQCFKR
ncbi:MAG: metallophosphoesterase [Gemmatimonadaceae bacterium]